MNDERTIVGLDIGSNVIKAAIGRYDDDGRIQVLAVASKPSKGVKCGNIVNIEDAKDAIQEVIEELEQTAGVLISSLTVSVGGSQIQSENSRGVVPIRVSSRSNKTEVTQDDIEKVIETAVAINYPADREKIHVIPQNYLVDGISVRTQSPINRIGIKLEVEVHIITASKTIIQNMKACMARANYMLDAVMLKTLAQTQSVCHEDEMELGSILIDIGADTTDVMVLINGAPVSTSSIQVGGNLVTNDIAVVTGIPFSAAEKIKLESGCCWINNLQDHDTDVILPGVGGRSPEVMARSQIGQIIQARMDQLFSLVRQDVIKNTKDTVKQLSGNIILTGGGAMLEGIVELAQYKFRTSAVRIGLPDHLGSDESLYRRPDFATVIGLLQANRLLPRTKQKHQSGKPKESRLKRLKNLFF